ncbi:DUF4416 family protein [bacterium]|nr:DUF4416 family protein [candidate division CSSED10-310 bacterium]
MKPLHTSQTSMIFFAVLSTDKPFFDAAIQKLTDKYGMPFEVLLPQSFEHTSYYKDEMGSDLIKGFIAFQPPFDQSKLPQAKCWARAIEWSLGSHCEKMFHRSVNIDPGLVTLEKIVLATSKNFSHRLYLGDGVYGEVTLIFHTECWETLNWTYPDYKVPDIQKFLIRCRNHLKEYLSKQTS